MAEIKLPEVWLRGPLPGIPALLQPVAHALLQAREEVNELMEGFPGDKLWARPSNVASPGFHLQHLAGVLQRLFTYAKGQSLSPAQLQELRAEGSPGPGMSELSDLLQRFNSQVDTALLALSETEEKTLTERRGVGRAGLPSTVLGLLFHAAEHTQRHTGQLLVTVKLLKSEATPEN